MRWLIEEKLTAALETLLVLKKHYYRVRTADLADALDIAVSAAAEQILQLEERGFAKRGERDCITLTERGSRYAETFYVGHATLRYRLIGEGMPEQEAELLACTMQKDVP